MGYKLKAALRTTLVPEVGPLPTYTRNLAAYVQDFEGLLKLVPANCARFGGARFVQNVANASITNTDSIAGSLATPNGLGLVNGSAVITAAPQELWPGPDGPTMLVTHCTLDLNGGTTANDRAWIDLRGVGALSLNGRMGRSTLWVRAVSGTPTIQYRHGSGTSTLQISTTWRRISVQNPVSNGDGTHVIGLRGAVAPATSSTADILICRLLMEEITGQTNQNPSEYVPLRTGLSFPYLGAGADGCQFFDYRNGNTVDASGFVTEAKGAAIAAATLKRYRKEKASTNLLLASSDLTNAAWVKTQSAIVADTAIGPDGALTMDKWIPNVGITGNSSRLHQLFTAVANQVYTFSFYASAAGQTKILVEKIGAFITVEGGQLTFDLAAGTLSATGSITGTMAASTRFPGLYECTAKLTATAAPGTGGFQFDQAGGVTGDGVNGIALGSLQVEASTSRTSYVPTTTAAVTRPEDVLAWPLSSFSDAQGTCYATAEADDWGVDVNNRRVIGDGNVNGAGAPLFAYSAGGFRTYDLTKANGTIQGVTPAGKMAGATTWNAAANTKRAFANAIGGPSDSYDGSFNLSSVGIGSGGGFPFQGYIGDVVILDTALSEFDVPSLPNYDYPRVAAALTGAVMTPAALTGTVLYPTALVGVVPQPAGLTGSA